MCAVASGSWAAGVRSGRLRQRTDGYPGGDRCRSVLMSPARTGGQLYGVLGGHRSLVDGELPAVCRRLPRAEGRAGAGPVA